jgi:rifampin ADP-ribosylating transferase
MDHEQARTPSIAEAIAAASSTNHLPTSFEQCDHVDGPFFHGTRTSFNVGDLLVPGHRSNYHEGRISNHVYFAALLEPAVWAAELATAFEGNGRRGHIYVVEPTGPFEDDPNVTDKKFPGNPTRSYRSSEPVRVVAEVHDWPRSSPEDLQAWRDRLAALLADERAEIIN